MLFVVVLAWCGFTFAVEPVELDGNNITSNDIDVRDMLDLDVEELKYDEYGDEIVFEPRFRPLNNPEKFRNYNQNPCRHDRMDNYKTNQMKSHKMRPCVPVKSNLMYQPKYQPPMKSYPMYQYPTWAPFRPLPTFAPVKPWEFTWPVYKQLPTLAPWKPVTFAPLKPYIWPTVKPLPTFKPLAIAPYKSFTFAPLPTFKPFVFNKVSSPAKSIDNYLPLKHMYTAGTGQLSQLLISGLNRALYLTFPSNSRINNVGNTDTRTNVTMVMIKNCQKTSSDISCKVPTGHTTTDEALYPEVPETSYGDVHFNDGEFAKLVGDLMEKDDIVVAVESKENSPSNTSEVKPNQNLETTLPITQLLESNDFQINPQGHGVPEQSSASLVDTKEVAETDVASPLNSPDLDTNPLLGVVEDQVVQNSNDTEILGLPKVNARTSVSEDRILTISKEPETLVSDPYREIDAVVSQGIGAVDTVVGVALWPILSRVPSTVI